MTDKIQYIPFDAATVPLKGSNLIEASAGTGKTYSIAILVLRLLLEQKITIREILMVTFTKAAVAELEERVRNFVRSAYKFSQGKEIRDDNIKALVHRATNTSGNEMVQQQLKDAVLFLDETSVLTIHSFCQQTLNEFAFETKQLFGAEMLPDIQPVIEQELNKYWRKHITTMPVALLSHIWGKGMKTGMKKAIEEHLGGKKYFGFDETVNYSVTKNVFDEWLQSLVSLSKKEAEYKETLLKQIVNDSARIISNTANANARRYALPLIGSPQEFMDYLWEKRASAYIPASFPELLARLEECDNCSQERKQLVQHIISHLNCLAIQEVVKGVTFFKLQNNLLGYDDMIQNLHRALAVRDNPELITALQEKYKAVFVDEFQDTDRQQFEIFNTAFGDNTILFYIGDPKQSIYAWRKADIFTYFKARNSVQYLYGMNHNYRSSPVFIAAMNSFFSPTEDFDTFFFKDDQEAINYHHVESPANNSKGYLVTNNEEDAPISIFRVANKELLTEAAAAQVALMLQEGHCTLKTKEQRREVKPSDIGILVRTGEQGRDIKAALSSIGIPAVTIDDSKVLQSGEASHLLYLLEAMALPDRSTINRALLSTFTGLDTNAILLLDDETTLSLFNKYKLRWQTDGIYTALMDFVSDFEVKKWLLQRYTDSGERILTNLFQLIELLHQVQSRKNLSMAELISWLKRGIDGMVTEGDEFVQRVESDEEAVKIVTIHKSKGLEYNIVLAPFLDFAERASYPFYSFRNPESGEYTAVENTRISDEQKIWYSRQAEQENRRLLYVAITRAVYKCIIFKNDFFKISTLSTFLNALVDVDKDLVRFEEETPIQPESSYRKQPVNKIFVQSQPVRFNLREQNWRRMSYTMLAAKGDVMMRGRSFKQEDVYENFILHTLKRGAKTGNLLHYIFENINFSEDTHWNRILNEAIRRFVPDQQELYQPMLRQLLQNVFNTDMEAAGVIFKLAAVDYNKRIAELEFDFPVPQFTPDSLNELSNDHHTVNVKGFHDLSSKQLEGIMNGKMDLFFEHMGHYYILDWKSNYLGSSPDDYAGSALVSAMNESNYHLQYLIYTLAAKKYLESRVPEFDYESQFGGVIYLFVRGMRQGTDGGIFFCRPGLSRIMQLENMLQGK